MRWPSFTVILTEIFLAYIICCIYNISSLFVAPTCEEGKQCLTSCLSQQPELQLRIYSSVDRNSSEKQVDFVYSNKNFNYTHANSLSLTLNIPRKTRNNGTLFLHIIIVPSPKKQGKNIINMRKDSYQSSVAIEMTEYEVPEAETFNLLGDRSSTSEKKKQNLENPVTHIKSRVMFTIMTDDVRLPVDNIPVELANHLRIMQDNTFLPIVTYDFLQTRQRDLVRVMPQNHTMNITLQYSPISIENLRLLLLIEATVQTLKNLGFSNKDVDEMKGIFADTNIYILGGTFIIAVIHLLFDFLAFKNDVSYWRRKDNLVGLSKWTVVWQVFSQIVIFLYLLNEGSSLLVLVPTGIESIIGMWKLRKVFKLRLKSDSGNMAEIRTRELDVESMHYLSYLLYPLVVGGAIYSLLYQPHKSWYSWSINSLVNGVYAFGFLFMLPQLFVNYKLKSVAHLPWKTFMYKAFNTFIDDVFAFIISTPTAHRIACFRDDVVFLIYLYQRWLYPVDKSRPDIDAIGEDSVDVNNLDKKKN